MSRNSGDNSYVLDKSVNSGPASAPILNFDALHRKPKDYHDFFFTDSSRIREQYERLYKVSRQMFCAPASQAPVERLFSISGHILSQRRLRTSDKNFENILFANVNSEVFDAELRKRKQPERDDDVE